MAPLKQLDKMLFFALLSDDQAHAADVIHISERKSRLKSHKKLIMQKLLSKYYAVDIPSIPTNDESKRATNYM